MKIGSSRRYLVKVSDFRHAPGNGWWFQQVLSSFHLIVSGVSSKSKSDSNRNRCSNQIRKYDWLPALLAFNMNKYSFVKVVGDSFVNGQILIKQSLK